MSLLSSDQIFLRSSCFSASALHVLRVRVRTWENLRLRAAHSSNGSSKPLALGRLGNMSKR